MGSSVRPVADPYDDLVRPRPDTAAGASSSDPYADLIAPPARETALSDPPRPPAAPPFRAINGPRAGVLPELEAAPEPPNPFLDPSEASRLAVALRQRRVLAPTDAVRPAARNPQARQLTGGARVASNVFAAAASPFEHPAETAIGLTAPIVTAPATLGLFLGQQFTGSDATDVGAAMGVPRIDPRRALIAQAQLAAMALGPEASRLVSRGATAGLEAAGASPLVARGVGGTVGAGGVGAAAGAAFDPEHPARGALIGGVLGIAGNELAGAARRAQPRPPMEEGPAIPPERRIGRVPQRPVATARIVEEPPPAAPPHGPEEPPVTFEDPYADLKPATANGRGFKSPAELIPLEAPTIPEVERSLAHLRTPEGSAGIDPGELASRINMHEAQLRKLRGEPEPEMAGADRARAAKAAGVRSLDEPPRAAAPASEGVAAPAAPAQPVVVAAAAPATEAPAPPKAKAGKIPDVDGALRWEAARDASGKRRSVEKVSVQGLMDEMLDLEEKRADAEARSVYELREDPNFHTSGIPQIVSTKDKNGGPSRQAKAARNLEDFGRITDEVVGELARRMPHDDIWQAIEARRAERDAAKAGEDNYVRDEHGNVLFERGPGYRVGERDLFGEEAAPSKADQGALFGEQAGTEASRSLTQTERAAKAELERLRPIAERATDPAVKASALKRIAQLEPLVNRGEKISAGEQATRAAAAKPEEAPPAEGGQGGLFGVGERAAPFYSRLGRAIDAAPMQRGTAQQWRAALSKDVAAGERDWTGVDRFLTEREGKGPITKDEVKQAFEGGAIRTGTVTLGGDERPAREGLYALGRADFLGFDNPQQAAHAIRTNPDWRTRWDTSGIPPEDLEAIERYAKRLSHPKYESYTEPGGENYREKLITLGDRPTVETMPERQRRQFLELVRTRRLQGLTPEGEMDYHRLAKAVTLPEGYSLEPITGRDGGGEWVLQRPDGVGERLSFRRREDAMIAALERIEQKGSDRRFRSSHFEGIPDILAHVRLKDRVLPNGEKVLHMEEVQSDWHQQGRRLGYVGQEPELRPGYRLKETPEGWELHRDDARGDMGTIGHVGTFTTKAAAIERSYRAEGLNPRGTVPDAPFKKADEWALLAVKHAIEEAVAGGYDRIAWTPGERQAARYDLSKHIDRVTYNPESGELVALRGTHVVHQGKYDAKALPDVIGKDAAKGLLASERVPESAPDMEPDAGAPLVHVLEGEGLKVGGAGMRGFYDKLLPRAIEAYAKKLGVPVQFETVDFGDAVPRNGWVYGPESPAGAPGTPPTAEGFRAASDVIGEMSGEDPDADRLSGVALSVAHDMEANGRTAEDALRELPARDREMLVSFMELQRATESDAKFPSFKISPELAAKVRTEGQPIMERARKRYADPAQSDLFSKPITSPAVQRVEREHAVTTFGSAKKAGDLAADLARMGPKYLKITAAGLNTSWQRLQDTKLPNRRAWVDLRGATIRTPKDAFQLLHPFRDPRAERFHVILLDREGKVLSHSMETSGALSWVAFGGEASPHEWIARIVARAKRAGAVRAIIAHNHPSGDPTPSSDDLHWTNMVGSKLQAEGIRLSGHLVINHEQANWMQPAAPGSSGSAHNLDVSPVPMAPDPDARDWTEGHGVQVRGPRDVATILSRVDAAHDALTVVYLSSQSHVIAVEPHRLESASTIAQWMPERMRALGARNIIIGAGRTAAYELANQAGRERLENPGQPHWAYDLHDIIALEHGGFESLADKSMLNSGNIWRTPPGTAWPDINKAGLPRRLREEEVTYGDQGGEEGAGPGARAGAAARGGEGAAAGAASESGGRDAAAGQAGRVSEGERVGYTPPPADVQDAFNEAGAGIDFSGKQRKAAEAAAARSLSSRIQKLTDALANGNGPIERLGDLAGSRPGANPRDLLTYVKASDATVRRAFYEGVMDPITRELTGPSFASIFAPLAHDDRLLRMALTYVKAKRDVGRGIGSVRGNSALFDRAVRIADYGDKDPVLSAFATRWAQFTDAIGEYAVKSGLWTPELWDKLKASDVLYVRYRRILDPGVPPTHKGGGVGARLGNIGPGVDRFEGSERAIDNPAEALAEYAKQIIHRADRYRVGAAVMGAVDELGPAGELIGTRIPESSARARAMGAKKAQQLPLAPDEVVDEVRDLFAPQMAKDNPVLWRNDPDGGGKEYMQIHAPELWGALMQINTVDNSAVRKFLDLTIRPLKRIFTATTTGWSPRFSLATNPARDVPDALAKSQAGLRPDDIAKGYGMAIASIAHKSATATEASRAGLADVSIFAQDRPELAAREAAPLSRADRVKNRVGKVAGAPVAALERAGAASDLGPRLGEYMAALRKFAGKVESGEWTPEEARLRAATLGRNVTLDFSNRPGNPVLRLFADYVPFFGVGLQAPVQFGISAARNPKRMAAAIALAATAGVVAWLLKHRLSKDELEAFNDRNPMERSGAIFVPTGKDGPTLRIPLGQEMGVIVNGVTTALDKVVDDDPAAGATFVAALERALPSGLDAAVQGVIPIPGVQQVQENARNKRVFGGRPVESRRLQDRAVENRRYDTTPPTFDMLAAGARKLGFSETSPLKAENIVRGVASNATPLVTSLTDPIASRIMGREAKPSVGRRPLEAPLNPASAFIASKVPSSTASEEAYYDLKARHATAQNELLTARKARDRDGVTKVREEYKDVLSPAVRGTIARTDDQVGRIRDEEGKVRQRYQSHQITRDAARDQLEQLAVRRQSIIRRSMAALRRAQQSPTVPATPSP